MAVDRPYQYQRYTDDYEFNKLVRDLVPQRITEAGLGCDTHIIEDDHEMLQLMLCKVKEEADEAYYEACLAAHHPKLYVNKELCDELGDVLEVIEGLKENFPAIMEEAEASRLKKRAFRGGYAGRTYLERTYSKE